MLEASRRFILMERNPNLSTEEQNLLGKLNIEAYIKSNLTTAISEGLNNKIKVLKRMGYGYSNVESFQLQILQRCGFLNSQFIDTSSWHWHIPHPQ